MTTVSPSAFTGGKPANTQALWASLQALRECCDWVQKLPAAVKELQDAAEAIRQQEAALSVESGNLARRRDDLDAREAEVLRRENGLRELREKLG